MQVCCALRMIQLFWSRVKVGKKPIAGQSKVRQWLDSSLLTLNKDKSHFIAFSMTAATQPAKDHIKLHKNTCNLIGDCTCEIQIYKTDMVKYLGVYIDKYLKWDMLRLN